MAIILNIDTATELAGVCLSSDNDILATEETAGQKTHASFIQPAIQKVLQTAGLTVKDIDAVAVTGGPGSYTGLRVGLSTAKGLCYALNKPLIMVNTLEVMAFAAIADHSGPNNNVLFCPMIDARRMEVFTALYTPGLQLVMPPAAMILDETSFAAELENNTLVFSGNGSLKAGIIKHPNAIFAKTGYDVNKLAILALLYYKASKFEDLAYCEPLYLKEFYKKA
jgi:tRNA threonylcarbamoyladenosine biosynthesis protein TsaB